MVLAKPRIERCGATLCGRIVWIPRPNHADGTPKRDKNNPDPSKWARPLLGLPILTGFRQDPKNPRRWTGGKIYNAKDGRSYRSILTVLPRGRLNVRGYVGVPLLGGSQNWTRLAD